MVQFCINPNSWSLTQLKNKINNKRRMLGGKQPHGKHSAPGISRRPNVEWALFWPQ